MLPVVTIALENEGMVGGVCACVYVQMHIYMCACVHECIGDKTKESEDLPKAIQLGNIFHLITLLSLVMTASDRNGQGEYVEKGPQPHFLPSQAGSE